MLNELLDNNGEQNTIVFCSERYNYKWTSIKMLAVNGLCPRWTNNKVVRSEVQAVACGEGYIIKVNKNYVFVVNEILSRGEQIASNLWWSASGCLRLLIILIYFVWVITNPCFNYPTLSNHKLLPPVRGAVSQMADWGVSLPIKNV